MNPKALALLIFIIAVSAAGYFALKGQHTGATSGRVGSLLLPDLSDQLNLLNQITITTAGNKKAVTLQKAADHWVVAEREGYPADIGLLRSQLVALSQAKILETKTSNSELYHRLGVQDVSSSDATGQEISLKSSTYSRRIIIGNPGPQINSTRYVRINGEETSWLIDKNISINQQTAHWLQKDLFDIASDRIATIKITGADDSVVEMLNADPKTASFKAAHLQKPTDEFADALIHLVSNALDSFQLLDVVPVKKFPEDVQKTSTGKYVTFDGIVLNLTTYNQDDRHFVRIESYFDEELVNQEALKALEEAGHAYSIDDAKALVMQLRKKSDGWIFQIPNVSHDALAQTYENMLVIIDK